MINLEAVPRHYDEAVRLLASWHRDATDTSFRAYAFPDPSGVTVRLIEVSDRFPEVGEVRPVAFGRSAEFPFPSATAQISPGDWARVESGDLALPDGWRLGERQRVSA